MTRDQFIQRLKELVNEAGVSFYGSPDYDGEENYIGSEYTFTKYSRGPVPENQFTAIEWMITMSELDDELP